jgi:hypothetical protein
MAEKTPIQVQFPEDELAAIDAYRRTQMNPPTRPQAIRDVLRDALGRRFNGNNDEHERNVGHRGEGAG